MIPAADLTPTLKLVTKTTAPKTVFMPGFGLTKEDLETLPHELRPSRHEGHGFMMLYSVSDVKALAVRKARHFGEPPPATVVTSALWWVERLQPKPPPVQIDYTPPLNMRRPDPADIIWAGELVTLNLHAHDACLIYLVCADSYLAVKLLTYRAHSARATRHRRLAQDE